MDLFKSIELTRDLFISPGAPGLFAVAFLGFFLLPIPPNLVLIPLALSEAARSLGEVEIYSLLGVAALIAVVAYLLRRRWMPAEWRTASD